MKHKSEDYKLSAVKYYLDTKLSIDDVCDSYQCSKRKRKTKALITKQLISPLPSFIIEFINRWIKI